MLLRQNPERLPWPQALHGPASAYLASSIQNHVFPHSLDLITTMLFHILILARVLPSLIFENVTCSASDTLTAPF